MLVPLIFYGAVFALALGLALYLTPIIRQGALGFGVVDHPDGRLKTQAAPVPYLGGVAVYLAFLIALSLVFEFSAELLGLLLGGTMVAMLGLFDDLKILAPRLKLMGQLLAAWVMVRSDITIQLEMIPESLALPLTVLWLVGITNALNLIDVSDGLASGVAAIAALGLFVIAVLIADSTMATTTLALAGALIGFLRYNQPPARIYLGDTGSLFVGFLLAALAMIGAYTQQSPIGALAPVAVLVVPILDTTLIVLARLARGESPFRGSPDHFAVRLRARGWSARRVAGLAYGLGIAGAATGVAMVLVPVEVGAASFALLVVASGVLFAWFWRLPAPRLSAASAADRVGAAGER